MPALLFLDENLSCFVPYGSQSDGLIKQFQRSSQVGQKKKEEMQSKPLSTKMRNEVPFHGELLYKGVCLPNPNPNFAG